MCFPLTALCITVEVMQSSNQLYPNNGSTVMKWYSFSYSVI